MIEAAQKPANESELRLVKLSTDEIFATLPEIPWISKELALCAGRPVELIGKGFSGKTLTGQTLALNVASGTPIFGHFSCTAGRVLHLDYEQGAYATRLRYQRLLRGMNLAPSDLEGRLDLVAKPDLYLTSPEAQDVLCKEVEGYSVVLIDALRGSIVDIDENDSKVRKYIDLCGTVSEKTGACFVFIHHGGKSVVNGTRDTRDEGRGSSAIFDAAGTVYAMQRSGDGLIQVAQTKQAAEARGKALEPFCLRIEDEVDERGNPNGVSVKWVEPGHDYVASPSKAVAEVAVEVVDIVTRNPRCSGRYIRTSLAHKATLTLTAIEYAERKGLIANSGTKAKPTWEPVGTTGTSGNQSGTSREPL